MFTLDVEYDLLAQPTRNDLLAALIHANSLSPNPIPLTGSPTSLVTDVMRLRDLGCHAPTPINRRTVFHSVLKVWRHNLVIIAFYDHDDTVHRVMEYYDEELNGNPDLELPEPVNITWEQFKRQCEILSGIDTTFHI